jgi:hypothetical protein
MLWIVLIIGVTIWLVRRNRKFNSLDWVKAEKRMELKKMEECEDYGDDSFLKEMDEFCQNDCCGASFSPANIIYGQSDDNEIHHDFGSDDRWD